MDNVKKKTGINRLYIASDKEDVFSLSLNACKKTLKNFNKKKIDCIIVVTQTAKNKLPSVSCMLQNELNLKTKIIALDIGLGCSGFVYALATINSFFLSNIASTALLVCSETYSKFLNKKNRTCRTVFSDAAAACIIKKVNTMNNINFTFLSDGSGANDLIEINKNIEMKGSNIFNFTTKHIPILFNQILKKNKLRKEDIDHYVFHQASKLVIESLSEILKLNKKKIYINYDKIGNTLSSSIPIVLENLKKKKKIKKDQKVMLIGFGVGLSAAATIINWS
jgi:3-oxoacyl-[acyl-carrier-protein] synthase-3